jgi:hypothetical protein
VKSAVRPPPTWSEPVGLGANRVRTGVVKSVGAVMKLLSRNRNHVRVRGVYRARSP